MFEEKENVIVKLTLDFALKIIVFCEELEKIKKWKLADQLFRSGTSIGANVNEAQNAESCADFIHKFKIAAKEAEETRYWLILCERSKNLPNPDQLQPDLDQIRKIIGKIITSTKKGI
jgi:four helix bundle protein